jgi:aspartate/methionine/tyrosine aminotransferase
MVGRPWWTPSRSGSVWIASGWQQPRAHPARTSWRWQRWCGPGTKCWFELDPDAVAAALSPDTRVIALSNLHNPSGVYASPEVLDRVGHLARSVGAKVLVDEVYLDTLEGVDTSPVATRDDVFVSTNSLTKSYGLAGLRVGWILADPVVVERARRARDVVDAVGSIPSETLGVLAFQRLDHLLRRARHVLRPGMELFSDFVAARPELTWVSPPGGAVGFPRLLGTDDASDFVRSAASDHGVGVTPGSLFGEPAHFRVAVAGELDVLRRGLDALGRALDHWNP